MSVASKRKGIADKIIIEPQTLNLNFDDFSDGTHIPDAYERLLFDAQRKSHQAKNLPVRNLGAGYSGTAHGKRWQELVCVIIILKKSRR